MSYLPDGLIPSWAGVRAALVPSVMNHIHLAAFAPMIPLLPGLGGIEFIGRNEFH